MTIETYTSELSVAERMLKRTQNPELRDKLSQFIDEVRGQIDALKANERMNEEDDLALSDIEL